MCTHMCTLMHPYMPWYTCIHACIHIRGKDSRAEKTRKSEETAKVGETKQKTQVDRTLEQQKDTKERCEGCVPMLIS